MRHRYAKDGKYYWFCMSPESRKYFTYEEAMSACLKNDKCEYVYESDCNDKGPFQICPITSGKGPSLSGCLYERDGNVLYCHFYKFQVLYIGFKVKNNFYVLVIHHLLSECQDHASLQTCEKLSSTCEKGLWTRKNCKKSCDLC